MRGMSRRARVQFLNVDQCQCGAVSRKPTPLLAISTPGLRDLIRQLPGHGKCNHISHPEELVGVREDVQFFTASAKQYPSVLSKVIAQSLLLSAPSDLTLLQAGTPPEVP